MSDVAFTPNSRGRLADRVAWTPGARTQEISLADEASYNLAGQRQDGASLITSKANMPFVGQYQLELSGSGLGVGNLAFANYVVGMPVEVASTAWDISTNVVTITVAAGHEVETGQWIVLTGNATAPAAMIGVAVQVTAVTATTVVFAYTDDDADATEAGVIKYQPISAKGCDEVTLYDNVTANDVDIDLGTAYAGIYKVFLNDGEDHKFAVFLSDGTEMIIETVAGPITAIDFDDADTDVKTNLRISAGKVLLGNRNAVAGRITVTFEPRFFTKVDADGFVCFFEKAGNLIVKNRLGAAAVLAIENTGTSRPNRVASPDPNPRITELQGPIT